MNEITRLLLLAPPAGDAARFDELQDRGHAHWVVDRVDEVDQAIRALDRGLADALVVTAETAEDPTVIGRLRRAASKCALVVVRRSDDERVPLDPQDVGIQSTLDLWTLDRQTLSLTLRLAVERNRLARAKAVARDQAAQIAALAPSRDSLTGLPVGEQLLQDVDRFLADAIRFNRPLSVALVTIDGLDEVRAARGDGVGDSVLIHAAGLLGQVLRTSDVLGRLGGDQLLLAMPGTDAEPAAQAARRIQAHLAQSPYVSSAGRFAVDATIGLSSLSGLMAVDELVFQADGALAEAVRRGPAALVHASELSLH